MATQINEEMKQKVWFVTSLLSWTWLRFCDSESFVGKVLDLNTNFILLEKWPRISEGIICLIFFVCLSNCGLATCHSEVTNRRYRVFFECKSTWESPNKLLTYFYVLDPGKNWKCKLWILSGFPLKFTMNLKAKLVPFQISFISWAHQQCSWSHKFYFRQFSRPLYDYDG